MRIHSSTLVILLVTLMFAGGSIGCRSNGGKWYNPKSYTWTNPFDKDSDPVKRNEAALANTKPSLGTQPSVSTPPSGYTTGSYSTAGKTEDARFHQSPSPTDGSKLASTSSPYGGYSAAENSYSPSYSGGTAQAPAPAGTPNYTYPGDAANQTAGSNTGSNTNVYPNQAYQQTSAVSHPQYAAPVPADSGNYAPFGVKPADNVPAYAAPQNTQPYNAQPYGNQASPVSYAAPAADPYANSAAPVYQPPVSNGY